ncbi:hypothetical protein [Glycomyces sp. MUSA5-2]|uniref:hypothetical protein n=1 Tax=Glycomyces sp. MUSA5-2 TaxID=2053002 RepID=UPI0030083FCC
MKHAKLLPLGACLLAAGLVLAACGGQSGGGSSDGGIGDTAAATADETSAPVDSGGSGSGVAASTPVEQVIVDLVDAVNAGDAAGAMEFVCEGSESAVQAAVEELAGDPPGLVVEEFASDASGGVTATAAGAAGGGAVGASIGAADISTGPCIAAVFVT